MEFRIPPASTTTMGIEGQPVLSGKARGKMPVTEQSRPAFTRSQTPSPSNHSAGEQEGEEEDEEEKDKEEEDKDEEERGKSSAVKTAP